MFNKPILPNFLNKNKSSENITETPAKPPMNPQTASQEVADAQKKIDEALRRGVQPISSEQTTPSKENSTPLDSSSQENQT